MTGYEHPTVAQLLKLFNKHNGVMHEEVASVLGVLVAFTKDPVLIKDLHEPWIRVHSNESSCEPCESIRDAKKRHVPGLLELCFWDGVSVPVPTVTARMRTPYAPESVYRCRGLYHLRAYCMAFELAVASGAEDPDSLFERAQALVSLEHQPFSADMGPHVRAYQAQLKAGFSRRFPHLRWAPYTTMYCGAKAVLGEEARFRQADDDARAAAFEPAQEQP